MIFDLIRSTRRVVMVDYDGTLAPFVVERDQAYAYPGVTEALDRLAQRADTRLVIVTGRSLADIKPLLRLSVLPEIIASHGWEKRDLHGMESAQVPQHFIQVLDSAAIAAQELGFGAALERKPASIALHWRGSAAQAVNDVKTRVTPRWEEIARHHQLDLTWFDGGIELRIPGKDKGTAVLEILAEEPADAFALYLGDDRTDEDAFAAIRDRGYGVLVRQEFRRTKAQLWTQPPEGLLALLEILGR
jgi:trehalose 6-phosphate phosphatase